MTAAEGPRAVDAAAGGAAGAGEVAALLAACRRRVEAFPLDPATDPAMTWPPETPARTGAPRA